MSRKAPSLGPACVVLGVALLAAGCAPPEPELYIGVDAQPISGGYEEPDDTSVVAILQPASGTLCSGTLIAPNAVLTAAHCVAPTPPGTLSILCEMTTLGASTTPTAFLITTAAEVTLANAGEFKVQEVLRVPSEDDLFCGNDIAVLLLTELVPDTLAQPREPRIDEPMEAGELFSAVGYGGTDNSGTDSGIRRRRDALQVQCVGDGCESTQVTPEEWLGDGGTCRGDSGGPALDAQERVVGVASRGSQTCDQSLYVGVSVWGPWLQDAVVRASGAGLYEAPAWTAGSTVDPEHSMPIGDHCKQASDCPTGRCLDSGTAKYCTRSCNADAPCPDGYTCEPRDGIELCIDQLLSQPPFQRAEDEGCAVAPPGGKSDIDLGWLLLLAAPLLRRRKTPATARCRHGRATAAHSPDSGEPRRAPRRRC